jgi:hypothetical protein
MWRGSGIKHILVKRIKFKARQWTNETGKWETKGKERRKIKKGDISETYTGRIITRKGEESE